MADHSIPQIFQSAKSLIDKALEKSTSALDSVSESFVQNVLRIKPAETDLSAEPEEVQWLESDRTQLKYRRDTLWAVPKMWTEMAAGAVGAGAYIFGVANESKLAQTIGWGLASGVKGVLLWADLGRPDRVWKVFAKPQTSWIARGSWAFAIFAGSGAISLLPVPAAFKKPAQAVAMASGTVLMAYDGAFLNESKGVPAWTEPSLSALFFADAVQAGASVANGLAKTSPAWLRFVAGATGLATAALHGIYVQKLRDGNIAAQLSARDLTKAKQANRFLIDSLGIGTIVPAISSFVGNKPCLKAVGAVSSMIGTYSLRRAVLQAGVHAPVQNPPRSKS